MNDTDKKLREMIEASEQVTTNLKAMLENEDCTGWDDNLDAVESNCQTVLDGLDEL